MIDAQPAAPTKTHNPWVDPNPKATGDVIRKFRGAVNAHCHVTAPESEEFPLAAKGTYYPYPFASAETLRALDDHLGFSREVLVAATCYGTDNRLMVHELKKMNAEVDRARGVAFVDKNISDQELLELHEAGVRGLRFSYVKRLVKELPSPQEMTDLANRLIGLGLKGWHIDVYCEAADLANPELNLPQYLKEMPLPVVFDHMAVPDLNENVNGPKFQILKDILSFKRPDGKKNMVKITCPERIAPDRSQLSGRPEDWNRVLPFAYDLIDHFPDQCITGTDWPHPNMLVPPAVAYPQMPNDGDLVNHWIAKLGRGDETVLQKILVDNPNRLFGFEPFPLELATRPVAKSRLRQMLKAGAVLA